MTDPKEFSYPGIVERCYEFCAWLLPKISKFPKDQRYILGNRLQNSALDMLEAFIDAAPASGQTKLIFLEEAQRRLEHVRFLLRLAYSIRMVNVKSYEYGSRVLVELGKMLVDGFAAWRVKQVSARCTARRWSRIRCVDAEFVGGPTALLAPLVKAPNENPTWSVAAGGEF